MEKELSGCRCSVEHLQQQLIHLQRSDTLERARQSNDEILAAMENKHKKQLYLLKEQLQNSEESSRNKVRINLKILILFENRFKTLKNF